MKKKIDQIIRTVYKYPFIFAGFFVFFVVSMMVLSAHTAHAAVTCNIYANPKTIPYGTSTTIYWTSSGGSVHAVSGQGITASTASGSAGTPVLYADTAYTMTVNWVAPKCSDTETVVVTPPAAPTCSLSAPSIVTPNASFTISWNSANATSATLNGAATYTFGSNTFSITSNTTYSLTFSGPGGSITCSKTVTVDNTAATCSLTASPTTIQYGKSAKLTWNSTGGRNFGISPDLGVGAITASGQADVYPNQEETYTFVINYGSSDQKICTAKVTVNGSPVPPGCPLTPKIWYDLITSSGAREVTVPKGTASVPLQLWMAAEVCSLNSSPVTQTQAHVTNVTPAGTSGIAGQTLSLSMPWTVGASAQDARPFTFAPAGGFQTSGTYTVNVTLADINYFPTEGKYICVVDVTRDAGGWNFGACSTRTLSFTITVNVEQNPPTCTLTASPTTINPGGSSTLTWSSTGGTSWGIDPNIGTITASGSRSVSPTSTTTYTFLVVGPGGSKTCTATVTVNGGGSGGPTCTLTASPTTINPGGSSTLVWSSTGGTGWGMQPNIGTIIASGSKAVSPTSSTTYTFVVTGPGGTVKTCAVTISVETPAPSCAITPSTVSIASGGSTTISWSTAGATSVTLNGSAVPVVGSQTVSPQSTTSYTIVASNQYGSQITCTSVVNVGGNTDVTPTCSISPAEETISPGGSVTLNWSSTGAISATLRDTAAGVTQTVSVNSPVAGYLVYPTNNTTYEFTATGPGGQSPVCRTRVYLKEGSEFSCQALSPVIGEVNRPAEQTIYRGQTTKLKWKVTNPRTTFNAYSETGALISNAVGETSAGFNVNPTTTTVYYLATSVGAPRYCVITIFVEIPSNKPYLRIDGSDVYSGAAFGPSCVPSSQAKNAAIQTNGYFTNKDTWGYSGSQYAAFASGQIGGMDTNVFLGNYGHIRPTNLKDLLFANDRSDRSGQYYGELPASVSGLPCVSLEKLKTTIEEPNPVPRALLNPVISDGSGVARYQGDLTLGSLTVNKGQKTIFIDGDLTINGDIKYATNYANADSIPYLRIVANNIYIQKPVSVIDAQLVAYPTADGANGVLSTCGDGQWTGVQFTIKGVDSCDRAITFNGSIIARRIVWKGTKGTVGEAAGVVDSSCLYSRDLNDPTLCAAEAIKFSPEAYIALFKQTGNTATGVPISTIELPPIY